LVAVFCSGGTCDASRRIADALRRASGERNIYWVKGGWPALDADGNFPLETGTPHEFGLK